MIVNQTNEMNKKNLYKIKGEKVKPQTRKSVNVLFEKSNSIYNSINACLVFFLFVFFASYFVVNFVENEQN